MNERRVDIDNQEYNGWSNIFTWYVYTCLSSYIESYDAARTIVNTSSSSYQAADALRDWMRVARDEWFEGYPDGVLKALLSGMLNNAFQQVDWDHLAKAFDESR